MSIQDKRAEILRLIDRLGESDGPALDRIRQRVHHPSRTTARPRTLRSRGGAARVQRERLEKQEATLAALRRQREALAAKPGPRQSSTGDPQLIGTLERIENRISAIESRVGMQSPKLAEVSGDGLPENCILGGGLRDGLLSDLLQLVSSNDWTGVFVVDDGQDSEIVIEFVEGEIWNARAPSASGQDAVFALMARIEGPYYFQETNNPPKERTVEGNTQFLILEGLRRLDEMDTGS